MREHRETGESSAMKRKVTAKGREERSDRSFKKSSTKSKSGGPQADR